MYYTYANTYVKTKTMQKCFCKYYLPNIGLSVLLR